MINNSHRKIRNGGEQRSKGGIRQPDTVRRAIHATRQRQMTGREKQEKEEKKKRLLQTISALAFDDISGSECGGNGNDGSVVMVGGRGIVKKKKKRPIRS